MSNYPDRSGPKNTNWKGGKPKCKFCNKILSSYATIQCRACYKKFHIESHCYQWQEKPTYKAVHRWMERKYIKLSKCEFCNKNPGKAKDGRNKIQWANKSGNYKRNREDWLCLCVSCHKKYDLNRII